jgi:hypothetical protein
VLIEWHNRLVRIPSKSGIVRVKHELPCGGGPTNLFAVPFSGLWVGLEKSN